MNLLDLPYELLVSIFKELKSVKELLVLESVCKTFHRIVSLEEIWKLRIQQDYSLLSYTSNESPIFQRRNFRQLYRALHRPEVFVWGDFQDGRLGIPSENLDNRQLEIYTPYLLSSMSNLGVSYIICGGYMMLALTHSHRVYFWGTFNTEFQYSPQGTSQQTPILLEIFPKESLIHQIASGRSHALALSESGRVFQFDNPKSSASEISFYGFDSPITQIACGFQHSLILTADHQLFCWSYHCHIRPTTYTKLVLPSDIDFNEKIVQIAAGDRFSIALTNFGKVYWWSEDIGSNGDYTRSQLPLGINLGLGSTITGSLLIESLDIQVSHITVQFKKIGLFNSDGKLLTGYCNLPRSRRRSRRISPTWVVLNDSLSIENRHPIQIGFGNLHTGALLDNGHLYTWGERGLGQGNVDYVASPTRISYFNDNYYVFYIACAGWHTAALAVNLKPNSSEVLPPHESNYFFNIVH